MSDLLTSAVDTLITGLRSAVYAEVMQEFVLTHKIENPFFSKAEMHNMATAGGTQEAKRFANCHDDIFVSPNSCLTFCGNVVYGVNSEDKELLTNLSNMMPLAKRLYPYMYNVMPMLLMSDNVEQVYSIYSFESKQTLCDVDKLTARVFVNKSDISPVVPGKIVPILPINRRNLTKYTLRYFLENSEKTFMRCFKCKAGHLQQLDIATVGYCRESNGNRGNCGGSNMIYDTGKCPDGHTPTLPCCPKCDHKISDGYIITPTFHDTYIALKQNLQFLEQLKKFDHYLQSQLAFLNRADVEERLSLVVAKSIRLEETSAATKKKLEQMEAEIEEERYRVDELIAAADAYKQEVQDAIDDRQAQLDTEFEIYIKRSEKLAVAERYYKKAANLASIKDDILASLDELIVIANSLGKSTEVSKIKSRILKSYNTLLESQDSNDLPETLPVAAAQPYTAKK